jgi:hypothetical protein
VLVVLTLALGAACGVDGREDLVGRYEADDDGPRQTWTLAGDGTCAIVRPGRDAASETTRCEWEYVEREGRTTLLVTVLAMENDAARQRIRYVLTPSRFPGSAVTIPLGGSGGQLRKVE